MVIQGCNIDKLVLRVYHKDLERADDGFFKSKCPVCKDGILLIRRSGVHLSRYDSCILCGQNIIYQDERIHGLILASDF